MARRYSADKEHLIGPALYPAFRTAVAIVLGIYAVVALLWALEAVRTTIYVIPFRFEFTEMSSPSALCRPLKTVPSGPEPIGSNFT